MPSPPTMALQQDREDALPDADTPVSLVKSKQRVADHGEVFTPPWLVDAMLDLVGEECDRIDSRFLEPACGSGNFLVRILQRKLAAVEVKYGQAAFEKQHFALYQHLAAPPNAAKPAAPAAAPAAAGNGAAAKTDGGRVS